MSESSSVGRSVIARYAAVICALSIGCSPALAGDTSAYTYDALGRLVQVSRTSTTANATTSVYTYDPASNRTNVTVTGAAAADKQTGQSASAACAGGAVCRYFMAPIAGFAPIRY